MSNGPPANLNTAHLIFGLAPEQTQDNVAELKLHYHKVLSGIDNKLNLADLLKDRLKDLPDIPAPVTLHDLVQAARRRLRQDRLQADVDELRARRYVIDTIQKALIS